MTFIKQPMPQQLAHMDTQYSEYHGAVFGSMGAFHHEADGQTLTVFNGGVLLGGTFYLLDGEETFTIKNRTTYVCVKLDKAEEGEPQFFLSEVWQTDSSTHYIATVLCITLEQGDMTQVDQIGGNLPNVYHLLDESIKNLAANIKQENKDNQRNINQDFEMMRKRFGEDMETNIKQVSGQVAQTKKAINTKIETLETKIKTLETKITNGVNKISLNENNLRTLETKIKTLETKTTNSVNKISLNESKLRTLDTKLGSIALYKHSIRTQFYVMGGGVVSDKYQVNLAFDVYSNKKTPYIDNPNSVGKPGLIEQITDAMCDNQVNRPHYRTPGRDLTVMIASGDFKSVNGSQTMTATIWGVGIQSRTRILLSFSDGSNADRYVWLSQDSKSGHVPSRTKLYEETIVRVL